MLPIRSILTRDECRLEDLFAFRLAVQVSRLESDQPIHRGDNKECVARPQDHVVGRIDVHAGRTLKHDDVDDVLGLDLPHGPAGERARRAHDHVGEIDGSAGELERLIHLAARRRGDERGRGDLRGGDRRHGERAGDLLGERFVEQANDHRRGRIEVAGREPGVDVREVVAGRQDHRAGLGNAGLREHLFVAAVPLDDGDVQVVDGVEERGLGVGLDGDHGLAELHQALNDAIPDLADADHHDVTALERGDHALPLREFALPGEHQVSEPDDRVRRRPQADDRHQEEERLEIPFVGELEPRFEKDHQEDGVERLRQADVLVVIEPVKDQPANRNEPDEYDERPPELAEQKAHVSDMDQQPVESAHRITSSSVHADVPASSRARASRSATPISVAQCRR